MRENRCVITGTGVLSPIGIGSDTFWQAVIRGKSGIGLVKGFDTSKFRTHYGAEINNFDAGDYLEEERIIKMGRASHMAIAASKMAIGEAGITDDLISRERLGVAMGTTMGEIQEEEQISQIWEHDGIEAVPAGSFLKYPSGNIPGNVAAEFRGTGPVVMIPTACAAGNYAIGYAYERLVKGQADIMIAGGVDPFSRVAYTGFHRLLSVAPELCQPFDLNRKGIMIGEGAGVLVMETLAHARKRGAVILAEVLGYGLGCDAYHMTTPHPDGAGGRRAIRSALKNARLNPEEINYISAHGTGTKENDRIETKIIKSIFAEQAAGIPISSIKSMIGHTMGAASAIEAVLCTYIVRNNIIPPTINYHTPDPECDLDYVPNQAREHQVKIALSNAFAFGGNDAALLIGRFEA